jgi:hypothetical protein
LFAGKLAFTILKKLIGYSKCDVGCGFGQAIGLAAKSATGQRRHGRPLKKFKSCPPMDTGKLHSQNANTPTNQAQVFNL